MKFSHIAIQHATDVCTSQQVIRLTTQTLLIVHQALVCVLIIFRLLIRLKYSFTAPKDILQEFVDLAETQLQWQILSQQSEYHNHKCSRVAQESADAFKQLEDGKEVEEGYKY